MPELPDSPTNLSRIGDFAMTTAEAIEARFGQEAMVGAIVLVVDLFAADTHGQNINPIVAVCNDPRAWVQAALLQEAQEGAEVLNQERQDAVEADHAARGWTEDEDDD